MLSLSWSSKLYLLSSVIPFYNIVSNSKASVQLFVKELNGEGNLTYINNGKENVTYVYSTPVLKLNHF